VCPATDAVQAALCKRLVENTLEPPYTWEVALSAGKDKRETLERLLCEQACRNGRASQSSGVDPQLVAASSARKHKARQYFLPRLFSLDPLPA